MWNDFTDFELAQLAQEYNLQSYVVFTDRLKLANREEVECMLTEYEYSVAFPQQSLDINSEFVYN